MNSKHVLFAIASAGVWSAIAGATCQAGAFSVRPIEVTFSGESPADVFGFALAGAGDVNNDGFGDLIVGAWLDDNTAPDVGSARVISGASGAVLHTFYGESTNDRFGAAVAGAGDVNNDGFDDLIVGAFLDDNNGADSGSVRVFSGADGAVLYTFNGDSAGDGFGYAVAGAGDVNNDGFDDLIVGAPDDDNTGTSAGTARVFSGASGAILYTFSGDSTGDALGSSVAGAGDVNNDGFADVIVGAFLDDNNGTSSGSARVFSGASGAILYTFSGDSAGDSFGISVSAAGDVNADGFSDLIVGASGDDNNGSGSGSARVFSGATGAVVYTFNGESTGDAFGFAVAGAGDVNADGFADLVVGAFDDDAAGIDAGTARVLSGASGQILDTFSGDATGDLFGYAVAAAGDVNGDGVADILVGAYGDDNNGAQSGSARLFVSAPGGWPPAPQPSRCFGDADGNRAVNFSDITTVLSNFGGVCP